MPNNEKLSYINECEATIYKIIVAFETIISFGWIGCNSLDSYDSVSGKCVRANEFECNEMPMDKQTHTLPICWLHFILSDAIYFVNTNEWALGPSDTLCVQVL